MAGGCEREYVLSRLSPYWVDPLRAWKAEEGTLWHEVMQNYSSPGWLSESRFPNSDTQPHKPERHRLVGAAGQGIWEFELWPGRWLSTKLDSVKADYSEYIDYKSKDSPLGGYVDKCTGEIVYSNKEWPVSEQNQLQLNLGGHLISQMFDVPLPKLTIWQLNKGIQDSTRAWKKYNVEPMTLAALRARTDASFDLIVRKMKEAKNSVDPLSVVDDMPLTGRKMYGGKKCTRYCGMKQICDQHISPELLRSSL